MAYVTGTLKENAQVELESSAFVPS